jgi:hypothetical protein
VATKKSTRKGEVLDERVSQTDQASLGAKSLSKSDIKEREVRGVPGEFLDSQPDRDNSVFAGNSEPKTWEQRYRENATHIDIRAGVKPKK